MNLVTAAALNADEAGVSLLWNCVFAGTNHTGFNGGFYQEARIPYNLSAFDQRSDNVGL